MSFAHVELSRRKGLIQALPPPISRPQGPTAFGRPLGVSLRPLAKGVLGPPADVTCCLMACLRSWFGGLVRLLRSLATWTLSWFGH